DEVVLAENQVDVPTGVREGATEVGSDLRHARSTGQSLGWTQVVADVVVGEHFEGELDIATIPHLLIEPADQRLVLRDGHLSLLGSVNRLLHIRGMAPEELASYLVARPI